MIFEPAINPASTLLWLARCAVGIVPAPIRKQRLVARFGLRTHAEVLRRQFEATSDENDGHSHWMAVQGAASTLRSLGISHPSEDAEREVWRAFLARVVVAAERGDIDAANSATRAQGFSDVEGGSRAHSPSPSSGRRISGSVGTNSSEVRNTATSETFTIVDFDEGGTRENKGTLRLVCNIEGGGKLALWGGGQDRRNIDSVLGAGLPCTVECEHVEPQPWAAVRFNHTHWVPAHARLRVRSG